MGDLSRATGPLAIVDLETSGLAQNPRAEIIEIGAVLFDPGSTLVRTVSSLVRPRGSVPAVVQRLTGLTDADFEDAPLLADVRQVLAGLLGGRVLIAHNADFERHFLSRLVRRRVLRAGALSRHAGSALAHVSRRKRPPPRVIHADPSRLGRKAPSARRRTRHGADHLEDRSGVVCFASSSAPSPASAWSASRRDRRGLARCRPVLRAKPRLPLVGA